VEHQKVSSDFQNDLQRGEPSVFQVWQPKYATRGFATFPVKFVARGDKLKLDKVPLVKHYMKLGLRASTELTRRFADAVGIGIALGARSGLAVADIDTKDENAVADVLAFYGTSPLIARSPSGGYHVYYRHNDRQRRRVRDPYWSERGIPVDVLGNGFITAPASRSPEGTYCFVQGDLDDLQRLPLMRSVTPRIEPTAQAPTPAEQPVIPAGHRNDQLFRHCTAPGMRRPSAIC
jgi:bifunctional DNA primase/polymerase-like protein